MPITATSSHGTTLMVGDGASPEGFTAVAKLTSISGPASSAAVIDTTGLEDTYATKLLGIIDSGQVSFEGLLLLGNTQHDGLFTDHQARTLRNFRIQTVAASPAEYVAFAAYVVALSAPGAAMNQANTISGTLEVSGAVTYP